jgi:hypothetical protein
MENIVLISLANVNPINRVTSAIADTFRGTFRTLALSPMQLAAPRSD